MVDKLKDILYYNKLYTNVGKLTGGHYDGKIWTINNPLYEGKKVWLRYIGSNYLCNSFIIQFQWYTTLMTI